MLRTIFVTTLAALGAYFAIQGTPYALMLYLWIAYFRPEEWVWTDFVSILNLSFLAGVYLLAITLMSVRRFPFNFRVGLLVLMVVQSGISVLASDYSAFAATYWLDFAKSIIITYLIVVLVTDRELFRLALLVLAVSLAFEPAKQAWVQLILAPGSKNFNSIGFLGDESGVGVGMLMLAPILGVLARTATRRWERWALHFLTLGVLYRAITTYSRGAFLGLGALAAVWFVRSPHKFRTALIAIVLGVLATPLFPDAFWERMSTITTSEQEMDASALGRVYFWGIAVRMANDHPLTGVGHNAFSRAFPQYDIATGDFGVERAAHSSWFAVLADLGYPGLILFLMSIGSMFLACQRVIRLARGHPELQALRDYAVALETSLAAFVVAGSFITFQYGEMLWHFIGLSIALLAIAVHEHAALDPVPATSDVDPTRARPSRAVAFPPAASAGAAGRFSRGNAAWTKGR